VTEPSSQIWRELSLLGPPVAGQFRVLPTDVNTKGGATLFGLDGEALYHVFIPVAESTQLQADTRSAGVHLERRVLEESGQKNVYLDVSCRKPHLRSVFVHLAEDVLRELTQQPDQPEVACRKVISRWRELLDRESQRLLSREALLGLYGELWFLRLITQHSAEAHRNWMGPLGAAHDFRSGSASLEVKATQAQEGWRFEIHGVTQLAPIGGNPLYLAACLIDSSDPNGESVPQLIEALVTMGCDTVELLKKLAKVGYDSRDGVAYQEFRYGMRETKVFVVDELFPRIVSESFVGGMVPNRVERLRYTIDLGAKPPIPLETEAVKAIVLALSEVS
jgi:hypothetical protein